MSKNNDQFNIIITGTGGQGLITLLQIIAQAALIEGLEVRTSELHGLSQRGGSVEVHIRFGKKVYSPLIVKGRADLVIALEIQESLKAVGLAGPKTKFLINKHVIPIPFQEAMSEEEILKSLKKFSEDIRVIPATEIAQNELGTGVLAGVYLLSLASFLELISLNPKSILAAIKELMPEKFLDINVKAFELARKNAKK